MDSRRSLRCLRSEGCTRRSCEADQLSENLMREFAAWRSEERSSTAACRLVEEVTDKLKMMPTLQNCLGGPRRCCGSTPVASG
jgi:hypothetical protein